MYLENIRELALQNTNFRKVLSTGKFGQLVVMSIVVGGEIGEEVHEDTDQILFFVEGTGQAILDDEARPVKENDVVFVNAGVKHNFKNTGDLALKLFTVYAPPHHPDGTIHTTANDAQS